MKEIRFNEGYRRVDRYLGGVRARRIYSARLVGGMSESVTVAMYQGQSAKEVRERTHSNMFALTRVISAMAATCLDV